MDRLRARALPADNRYLESRVRYLIKLFDLTRTVTKDKGAECGHFVGSGGCDLRRDDAGFTKAHFALGKIDYGKGLCGYLLYIKSSLTGNERGYIRDYKRNSPGFPLESRADQFSSEAQFEAHRARGERIGDDLFLDELAGPETGRTFESWFNCLVFNLQEERIA